MARLHTSLATLALLLSAIGCGQSSGDDDPPPNADAETVDEGRAAEYDALPPTVMIGVTVDEDGHDVVGTGELRVPAATTDVADDDAALAAYATGLKVRTVATVDELDGDTSTQSWASPAIATDYSIFTPQAYSRTSQGSSYTYSQGTRYQSGTSAVYVYHRPPCAPPYCRPNGNPGPTPPNGPGQGDPDQQLLAAMAKFGVKAIAGSEWTRGRREVVELGARLFNDKILSAKGDVACSSCHIDQYGTGSIYSLNPSGPVLAGRERGPFDVNDLLGRNSPPLYNLGHKSYDAMFWDGRVRRDPSQPSGFLSPAGDDLPLGLDSALAVQALFPLIASNEMGCGASNGMQTLMRTSPVQGWSVIMSRVMARPDYKSMFKAAFPNVAQPTIADLANAIAAYEADRWRADDSPFDRYLRGDKRALTSAQKVGASYFYGKGNCAGCHSGALQTDHQAHAIGMPQWGPGAGDGASGREDYGVARVTGNAADRYKFKTPSLRNVAVTGPWGHDGAYRSLRQFVSHYTDPARAHDRWQPSQLVLPQGFRASKEMLGGWNDPQMRAAVRNASQVKQIPLTNQEIDGLVEFLIALTDPRVARNRQALIVNP